MIRLERSKEGIISVVVDKQKDELDGGPIRFRLKQVPLGTNAETGDVITSAVLVDANEEADAPAAGLADGPRVALLSLASLGGRAESGEWRGAISMTGKAVAERTFHNWKDELIEQG
jgi:hypothetical protein